MKRSSLLLTTLAGLALPGVASAQSITANGTLTGRFGYGSNPYLGTGSSGGTANVEGTLSASVRREAPKSVTTLNGIADVTENFGKYGRAESYLASLSQQQTFSERLQGTAHVSYQDALNPRGFASSGGTDVDLLAIGQRSRTFMADGNLNWTPSTRDSFYIGPSFSHATFGNSLASKYDSYGLRGGYLRRINSRLRLGFDGSTQHASSQAYGSSNSYQGGLHLTYDFSAFWTLDSTVSLIRQTSSQSGSQTTIGFTGNLCGKYARYDICFGAARQSAPSGYGGLRTDNRFDVRLNYRLSQLSTVHVGGIYDVSQSGGFVQLPRQTYWDMNAGYSRTLGPRLSGGFSGRYQHRDYGNILGLAGGSANSYAVTVDVEYSFGRNN